MKKARSKGAFELSKAKGIFSSAVVMILLTFSLFGCGGNEAIVGTWVSNGSGATEQYEGDGSFTYTNGFVTELGVLKGTWEKYERTPTISADGKDWQVYVVIPEGREIVGEGELGNQHKYNDKYGDYYQLVSGDEMVSAIGAGNVDKIAQQGTISGGNPSYSRQ